MGIIYISIVWSQDKNVDILYNNWSWLFFRQQILMHIKQTTDLQMQPLEEIIWNKLTSNKGVAKNRSQFQTIPAITKIIVAVVIIPFISSWKIVYQRYQLQNLFITYCFIFLQVMLISVRVLHVLLQLISGPPHKSC